MKGEPHVLVVDDDPDIATMLVRALSPRGFVLEAVASADEALRLASTRHFDAALVDLVMPGRDGKSLAAALREKIPGIPIGLLTGYARSPLLESAERSGVAIFIKPVVIHEIEEFLRKELTPDHS
jgi:CheY-like chemotaxis protein